MQEKMNRLGHAGIPFIFMIDFEMAHPVVIPLHEVRPEKLLYEINGISNCQPERSTTPVIIKKQPVSFHTYRQAFRQVQQAQIRGDSYLTNLTFASKISLNSDLLTVFHAAKSKYKLWFENRFVVFSPETFIKIRDGYIFSYPMKGTIDAQIPDAANIIMNDPKEKAEHNTIVDLIRNDLSMVAKKVRVSRFRYLDNLYTSEGELLQVSSEIKGRLPENYLNQLGDIFYKLLPAGSISGAPKKRTLELIQDTEKSTRGYYTGVAGIFDGKNADSFVMIRFIEKTPEGYFYRSGGGITTQSDVEKNMMNL